MARSTKSKRKPPRKRKPGAGRPTVYDPVSCCAIVRKLRGEAKTTVEIAATLGVARSTFDEWRKTHPEFRAALEEGDEDADLRIERALFERAVGYKHPETKLMVTSGGHGVGSSVERHEVTTHYPPDPTCLKFWLTNRRRKFWSDKQKIEHGGTLTLEQLLAQSWKDPNTEVAADAEKKPETT